MCLKKTVEIGLFVIYSDVGGMFLFVFFFVNGVRAYVFLGAGQFVKIVWKWCYFYF